jgi:DNA-binding response OmpR family regulator
MAVYVHGLFKNDLFDPPETISKNSDVLHRTNPMLSYNEINNSRREREDRTMTDTKILIVDDDSNISELLKMYFENEGYDIKIATDGVEGIHYFKMYEPDLVLLDIMLPKKDGWQVCREIREMSAKPVIMITAKSDVFDKVLGLELGADDFVVKPFDMKELSARVKAVLRRYRLSARQNDEEVIKFENIEISLQKYELKLRGRSVDIPPKELELLYFLASNYNRVFTRDQLLDKVWGFDYLGDSRTVDVHVKRLREKLEGASDKWLLKTVWGVGYKFELLN